MTLKFPVLDTIGCEFETGISQEDMLLFVRGNSRLRNWLVHHDGSIDKSGVKLLQVPYYFESMEKRARKGSLLSTNYMFGSELVSPLIDVTQETIWKDAIKDLTDFLRKSLDKPSTKVSMHVHVNCDKLPVGVLQNIVKTWMCFEDVFFRLSIGDELKIHRGTVRKDFLYCRPLSKPLVVSSDNRTLRPCFEVNKLLLAKNLKEFFYSYGRCQIEGEPPRYYPARYSAVNFYSYLRPSGGSVEFRTPNLSTNPNIIFAWIELFQAIVKTSMGKPLEYPFMPLGTSPKNFNLDIFQSLFELSDETMTILNYVFNENDWVKFNPRWIYSHTSQTEIFWENEYPELIPTIIPRGQKIRRYSQASENDDYDEFDARSDIPDNSTISSSTEVSFRDSLERMRQNGNSRINFVDAIRTASNDDDEEDEE